MNQSSNKKLENANRLRQIGYWVDSAAHDLDVAETLFKSGKYDWCLFIAHLVLEKMFKALYPDEKLKFYKMCTHDFTRENFQHIKEIYECLLKKI